MKTDNIAAKQIKPLLLHCLCEALVSNADEVVEQAVEVLVGCDNLHTLATHYII